MTISEKFTEYIQNLLLVTGPKIILAVILLIVGSWLIKLCMRYVFSRFEKRDVDLSLRVFLSRIIKFALYIMLFLSVAGTMGIKTTSFLAMLGGIGLAVGLALQGSLSNFAGGILILLFKPFRVGDYVSSTNNAAGTIEKIDILYTTMRSAEGIAVFAPNGPLANSVITNYSNLTQRRAEYIIGISYESDINHAREVILQVLKEDKRVLSMPAPQVLVGELAASSVNLIIRCWAPQETYWAVYHENYEKIKVALDKNDIPIPYPQQEMHIVSRETKPTDQKS